MIDVETLYTAARELRETLLPAVQALIPHASNQVTESQTGTRKATVHRIPWHGPAADVFYDIHAQVRRYESALTLLLFQHAKYRGGDDTNTYDALSRLPVLIAHAIDAGHHDHGDVRDAAQLLGVTWPRECRRVLDALRDNEQPWTRAPGDLRCPYCDRPLELAPGWSQALRPGHDPEVAGVTGDLWCRRCRTDDGGQVRFAPSQWTGKVLTEADQDGGEPLVTAAQAEAVLGRRLPAATIRSWAHRGEIEQAGTTKSGAKLYRLADLRERVGGAA